MVHLRDINSGFAFASNISGEYGVNFFNGWDWITRNIASHFECDEDDIECVETDAGDVFTVKGEPVAYFDDGQGRADFVAINAAAFPQLQAAE